MKRLIALCLSAACVLVLGCGVRSYEERLNLTLKNMRYRQRLDQYLGPPAAGKFQDLSIFLRPPQPLAPVETFQLSEQPGMYDLTQSFMGTPAGAAAKDAPPPAPLRLHVLARVKRATPKTAKGAPQPEATAARGPFAQDIVNLVASDFGAAEALQNATFKSDTRRKNSYKRLIFKAPATNSDIQVYLNSQKTPLGEYDVALIWDIPPGLERSPAVVTAIPLCLEVFAVGPRAQAAFAGAVGDEEVPGGVPAPGAAPDVPGTAF